MKDLIVTAGIDVGSSAIKAVIMASRPGGGRGWRARFTAASGN